MDELIQQAKQKNPAAFEKLIRLHMQSMYKAARAYLSSDEDVADAIQETILTCYEKIPDLKNNAYFKTWMIKILIHKCCDILRNKKILHFSEETVEQPALDKGFEVLEWKEVIRILDEKYRLVMVLYYVEGFRTGEIAQILDMNENTVRTRLKRGREELKNVYLNEKRREKRNGTKRSIARKAAGRNTNTGNCISESRTGI